MIGKNRESLLLALSVPLYIYLGYSADRSNAFSVVLPYTILFLFYFLYLKRTGFGKGKSIWNLKRVVVVAFLLRLSFLFSIPLLSDDVYRFVWDGHMLLKGLNPYLTLPIDEISNSLNSRSMILEELFSQMNSPSYYTVYPPFLQGLFSLAALVSPNNFIGSIVFLRIIIILFEVGTVYLIYNILLLLKRNTEAVVLYAFNPLVIVELNGNLHMEAVMLFFFSMSIYLLLKRQYLFSSLLWAMAVCSKIIPLMFLPVLIPMIGWKKSLQYYMRIAAFIALLSIPFINSELIIRFFSSIDLYFRSFEFNASLYYVVREVGYAIKDYNTIQIVGPVMALIAMIIILVMQLRKTNNSPSSMFHAWLFSLSVYLIFATTVHPWYLVSLVFVAVFCGNMSYAFLWSALCVLSYHHYHLNQNQENYFLVALQYLPVFALMLYEIRRRMRSEVKPIEWKL